VIHHGLTIVDTTSALYVWEIPYFPYFYIPWSGIPQPSEDQEEGNLQHAQWEERGILTTSDTDGTPLGRLWRIHVDEDETHAIDNVLEMIGSTPQIGNMLRIPFASAEHWLEEDTPIYQHPKDPFRRVDTLTSLRSITVSLNGTQLATSPSSIHLYETDLPCRYYIPLSAINARVLRKSSKRTQCPYKGEAEYYDVVLKDEKGKETVHEGLVWYYTWPNLECAQIAGLCCFYNEKVDIEVDGVKMERPRTHFG